VSIHYFRFTLRDSVERQRSALLESLVARADACLEVGDWRAAAFRILAPRVNSVPGVGAAAWFSQGSRAADGTVYLATPVHYVAEMSNVRLPADGVLSLERREADKLAADFNRVWADAGVRLAVGRRADLFCIVDHSPAATTRDPVDALGRHIDFFLPTGEGAPRLRQLMSEIEMWLFDHEVNRNRAADAAPTVNGLWLWGGGAALSSLPQIEGWTAGEDPLFASWTQRADTDSQVLSQAASGVAVFSAQPGTTEWREVELNWLQPSLRALRSGRIERVDLSAGRCCFSVGAAWRWRLWRRQRPWWESFT
jgi:hypothetical protein